MPKILVADDNSRILKDATAILKQHGFDVVTVGNGEAAVKELSDPPDLVLADIFMPVRNGFEVCQYIKKDERFAHIPVILLQGKFDPLDDKEVRRVGADAVLRKPFEPPETLVAAVKSHLQRAAKPAPGPEAVKATKRAAAEFAAAVPSMEQTQRLTPGEIGALTGGKGAQAAEVEEFSQFGAHEARVEFKEGDQTLAFGDLLDGGGAATEAEPAAEEEAERPSFDIQEEARKPSPDEPPIKVEFGPAEPMELVRDEPSAALPMEIPPAQDLATSAHEWVSEMPIPTVAPPPEPVAPPPPAVPAPQISFDVSPLTAGQEPPQFAASIFKPPAIEPPPVTVPFPELADAAPPQMAPTGMAATELPGLTWSPGAVVPEPPPHPPVAAEAPEAPASAQSPVEAALVDALVERVLNRLTPELSERIAQEIARRLGEQFGRPDLKR